MHKVLIVEDESIIRKGLICTVDWAGLGCVVAAEAANGKEGLAKITEVRPDLVITDIRMPLMGGIEMIEEGLKVHPFESIILSGYGEFSYAQTAIRLGVGEYLLKPVESEKLCAAVTGLCEKMEKKPGYDRMEILPETAGASREALDLSLLDTCMKTASRHVASMLRQIKEHYREKLSLKDLSTQLEISATYLNQKFKEETTYTYNDFLNRYRIQKAAEMLELGNYRIYEIAELVGFSDYKYFIMVFHKYMGCAPTKFAGAGRMAEEPPI